MGSRCRRSVVAVWLVAAACLRSDPEPPARALAVPHVVLVSLDTLRADRLDAYGYERETAPVLAALAREGVRFAVAGAQATQTLLSHKAIFAAKYPLRLLREATNADLATLAAVRDPEAYLIGALRAPIRPALIAGLRDHGYRTAAFTDGGWMSAEMGFADGFEDFDEGDGHLAKMVPRIETWLAAHADRPFFLFVHTYDTHCPYPCREPFNTRFCRAHDAHVALEGLCGKPDLMGMKLRPVDLAGISDHYDGGIASADAHLGELFAALRRLGIWDEALVIVTSDHGESLGEHGQIGHGGLWPEQLLVPLIVKLPASRGIAGRTVAAPVETIDVFPTIYEVAGIALPSGLDGRSLLPLAAGEGGGRPHLIAQATFREGPEAITNPAKRAILEPGRWLLIHDARAPRVELYDLAADPKALVDVAGRRPPELPALLEALGVHDLGRATGARDEPAREGVSRKLEEQLKALGYVD